MAFMNADAARRPAEPGQQAAEEQPLYVQRNVVRVGLKQGAGFLQAGPYFPKVFFGKGAVEPPTVPDQQPVDVRIAAQQNVGGGAYQPGDMTVRAKTPEIVRYGCGMQDVADGAEPRYEDAGAGRDTGDCVLHEYSLLLAFWVSIR